MTRARNSANLASHGNLFVDITNDRTGIGSVVPAQNLHVAGTAGFHADVTLTGDLYNTTWDRSDNSLKFVDNAKAKFGTSENLQIYYDSSSYITNGTAGHLFIKTLNGGSDIRLESNDDIFLMTAAGSRNSIICRDYAQVELYYNNTKRFETTNTGAVVTGVLTATSFSGDGSSLSNLPAGAPVGGASTNTVFFENDKAVAVNYQITSTKNAMSAGPISINAGIAVTVPSGSSWTIV